ncbi:MAG: transcriptional regulator [Caulobacterales bacterium 32-69-10]|nr:MAG: transcriptional regulator [Caulobacterales bacterium 32-69-10]
MLSRKAKYALKAMVQLARAAPQQLTSADIADRTGAPRKFLEAILLELVRAGLILARRGKGGGYLLNRSPEQISFAEVIRATDGPLALAPCVSKTAFHRCADCLDMETCSIRPALQLARDATAAALEKHTLATAMAQTPEAEAQLGA